MTTLLEVRQLSKSFGDFHAVKGISFSIKAGTCFGLLGPNGAGKSTSIEMIEGIATPTSGEILFKGKPRDKSFPHKAGIQFQSTALMDYLRVIDVLKLFTSFYKRTRPLKELIEICELGNYLRHEAAKLSGGQRQRLLLALALINDPEILFLDEPTTGLDPQSRRKFWSTVNSIKQQGKTVLLTTHYMDEAEDLCDRLVIMDHGKIISEGAPKELLLNHFSNQLISLDFNETTALPTKITGTLTRVENQLFIETASVDQTLRELIAANIPLHGLTVREYSLEDLFIDITGKELRN